LNLVIDANVIIKAYVPEILSDRAEVLFRKVEKGEVLLVAPDIIYSEIGNILWKKHRLKELSASEVREICNAIVLLPLRIESSKPLMQLAVEIGIIYNISIYDAIYVSLAKIYETRLLTADKKLTDMISKTPLKGHIEWLGR
jgi:predicted nucleic acid-binding protein